MFRRYKRYNLRRESAEFTPMKGSFIEIETFPVGQNENEGKYMGCYLKPVEGKRVELIPLGRIDISGINPKIKYIDFDAFTKRTSIRFTRVIELSFYKTIGRTWEVVVADV